MGAVDRRPGDPPSPYEQRYGYSRIARAGGWVMVGGTTSIDSGTQAIIGTSAYEQTLAILRRVEHELARLGAGLGDVVQTRVYVTDIARSDEVARAHGEAFGEVRPLMTLVEVSALIDPRMLVEIEAVAYTG
jgi:enamine deaminase RidA (YjgF/YER057c/UK114 family)